MRIETAVSKTFVCRQKRDRGAHTAVPLLLRRGISMEKQVNKIAAGETGCCFCQKAAWRRFPEKRKGRGVCHGLLFP